MFAKKWKGARLFFWKRGNDAVLQNVSLHFGGFSQNRRRNALAVVVLWKDERFLGSFRRRPVDANETEL